MDRDKIEKKVAAALTKHWPSAARKDSLAQVAAQIANAVGFYRDAERQARFDRERKACRLWPDQSRVSCVILRTVGGQLFAVRCDVNRRTDFLFYNMAETIRQTLGWFLGKRPTHATAQTAALLKVIGLDKELDHRGLSPETLELGLARSAISAIVDCTWTPSDPFPVIQAMTATCDIPRAPGVPDISPASVAPSPTA